MIWLVVFLGGAAVVASVLWFTFTEQHPERADRHHDDHRNVDAMGRGTRSPGIVERPAGPDAENMAPDPQGRPAPPGRPRPPDRD